MNDQASQSTAPTSQDFPVRWENSEDRQLQWRLMGSRQIPPLLGSLERREFEAFANGPALYGGPPSVIRIMHVNGYLYRHQVKPSPDAVRAWQENPPLEVAGAVTHPLRYWQEEVLPEVRRSVEKLETAEWDSASLQDLQYLLDQALALDEQVETLIQPVSLMLSCVGRFEALHAELLGSSDPPVSQLVQGKDNLLLQMNRELIRLSGLVTAHSDIAAALAQPGFRGVAAALRRTGEGRAFLAELEAFLRSHGRRFESRDIRNPHWLEDPSPVLRLLRDGLGRPGFDPEVALAASVATWERAREMVYSQLRDRSPDLQERYRDLLRRAEEASVVKHDYDVWMQHRSRAALRDVLMALARRLVADRLLDQTDDLWWLTTEDLLGESAPGDWRALTSGRRAEWARFSQIAPPASIGSVPPEAASTQPPAMPHATGALQGLAACGGVVRARARHVESLDDAARLRAGEIVVTRSVGTSTTPVLARAAALVVDHDSLYSPGTIVARELGIPTVVQTQRATTTIKEGDTVEVDGARGTVRVVSP